MADAPVVNHELLDGDERGVLDARVLVGQVLHEQLLAAELLHQILAARVEVHVLADVVRGDRHRLRIALLLKQLYQHPTSDRSDHRVQSTRRLHTCIPNCEHSLLYYTM